MSPTTKIFEVSGIWFGVDEQESGIYEVELDNHKIMFLSEPGGWHDEILRAAIPKYIDLGLLSEDMREIPVSMYKEVA